VDVDRTMRQERQPLDPLATPRRIDTDTAEQQPTSHGIDPKKQWRVSPGDRAPAQSQAPNSAPALSSVAGAGRLHVAMAAALITHRQEAAASVRRPG
jgi:hypothetical protein